jgi:hypothetical protein
MRWVMWFFLLIAVSPVFACSICDQERCDKLVSEIESFALSRGEMARGACNNPRLSEIKQKCADLQACNKDCD